MLTLDAETPESVLSDPVEVGIYDDLTSDHIPGLQKYDMCMTEQVPGPQGVKIVGRHIASAPKGSLQKKRKSTVFSLPRF